MKEGMRAWWPQHGTARFLGGKGQASQSASGPLRETEADLKGGTSGNTQSNQDTHPTLSFCFFPKGTCSHWGRCQHFTSLSRNVDSPPQCPCPM